MTKSPGYVEREETRMEMIEESRYIWSKESKTPSCLSHSSTTLGLEGILL